AAPFTLRHEGATATDSPGSSTPLPDPSTARAAGTRPWKRRARAWSVEVGGSTEYVVTKLPTASEATPDSPRESTPTVPLATAKSPPPPGAAAGKGGPGR